MGLYSGVLITGRIFGSDIWKGLFSGGLIIGRIFASEIWGFGEGGLFLGGLIIGGTERILLYVHKEKHF